ncbi:hypothetical protein BDDG_13179, partial [Blastomyces dermatitidis ATCC 18188]
SSHVDRSVSADNSELNIESLIKNLKNAIMKKLSVSCITESFTSLSILSVSFSVTLSQSSTPVSVSGSPASAISVLMTLTSATSDFTVSAFVISSPCFKKMLYRLNKSYLSAKDICVFRNRNADIVLFYTHRFASVSEVIIIKDDNTTETTLSHFQASLITFSSFSARKVVHTSDY